MKIKEYNEKMRIRLYIKAKLMTTSIATSLGNENEDFKVVDGFCLLGMTINGKGGNI